MKKIYLNTLTPEDIFKRLKNGEVVNVSALEEHCFKMIDGIICYITDKNTYINSEIDISNSGYYFEEPEEFKVENDGKYKTRDGRIAWVSDIYNNNNDGYFCRGIITGDTEITEWGLNGKLLGTIQNISDEDLVEYVGDRK